MKKKQEISFRGILKTGQIFFTSNFEACAMNSTVDPIPANRKSRRAIKNIVKGIENDQEQEYSEADRLQKEKRKARKKASYLSRRFNQVRTKAA